MTVQRSPGFGLSAVRYYLYTIFLFTKNDVLTAIIPVALFCFASAPLCSPVHIFRTLFWGWLHILQFNISNQIKGIGEDKVNKPDRPLPAGRISIRDATILRWLLVPFCLAYSSCYSAQLVSASVGMQLFAYWYNEMDGDGYWLSKNAILALMYGCSELGGTLAASCDPSKVSGTAKLAVQLTIAVFTSTVHAQDFKDAKGDSVIGRRSAPIMFPIASRYVVSLGIPMWSFLLCCIWDVDWFCTAAFVAYGCFVGGRFFFLRTRDADKRSCKYYSIWFSFHHLLPGYWNYVHGGYRVGGGELATGPGTYFQGNHSWEGL